MPHGRNISVIIDMKGVLDRGPVPAGSTSSGSDSRLRTMRRLRSNSNRASFRPGKWRMRG